MKRAFDSLWPIVVAILFGIVMAGSSPVFGQDGQDQDKGARKALLSPKDFKEWAEVGTGVGKALVSAAKEVGTATEEFAKTDIGKITTAVVVWKVMNKEIRGVINTVMHILVGIIFPLFWFIGVKYYRNSFLVLKRERESGRIFSRLKSVEVREITETESGWVLVLGLLSGLVSLVSLLTAV